MRDSRQWIWSVVALLAAAVVLLATTGTRHLVQLALLAALLLPVSVVGFKQMMEQRRVLGSGTWEVYVNGVAVGTISGQDYLRLKREAYCDPDNATGQVANVVSVIATLLRKQLVAIPVTLFWFSLLLMLVKPDLAASALDAFRAGATPAQLAAAAKPMLAVYLVTVVAAGLVVVMFGCDLGFRNRYDEAIKERLRRYCKTPATGDVQLYRPVANPGAGAPAGATSERN